jgi:hypothetical protein
MVSMCRSLDELARPALLLAVDGNGQHRLFHGLALDNNFALPSMTQAQMETMVEWGMNVVRYADMR